MKKILIFAAEIAVLFICGLLLSAIYCAGLAVFQGIPFLDAQESDLFEVPNMFFWIFWAVYGIIFMFKKY
jgi:hypothetical protein